MAPKQRSTLLETLETAGGEGGAAHDKASERRRAQRRDTEEKVERVEHSRFRDLTPQTGGTTRNGATLRQKLLRFAPRSPRMGSARSG